MTEFSPNEVRAALTAIADGTVSQCRENDDQGIFRFLYGHGYIDGVRVGLNRFQLDDIVLTDVGHQYLASLPVPR
jgi:hypothetical protein